LYSSVKPSSVKGGCTCENWDVGTNNKLLGGPGQIRKIQCGREPARGSVRPEDEAGMDIFARCFKR
jgi:hypothetical protein